MADWLSKGIHAYKKHIYPKVAKWLRESESDRQETAKIDLLDRLTSSLSLHGAVSEPT